MLKGDPPTFYGWLVRWSTGVAKDKNQFPKSISYLYLSRDRGDRGEWAVDPSKAIRYRDLEDACEAALRLGSAGVIEAQVPLEELWREGGFSG